MEMKHIFLDIVLFEHGYRDEASIYNIIPVVPHKAVAEVLKNRKPIGEVGCCESGMAERSH